MVIDRDDWTRNGDELVNPAEEAKAANARVVSVPTKLKAVIKFGYEEGMLSALNGQDFDTYIEEVFTHTKAYYRLAASLGTTIEFEVCELNYIQFQYNKH